MSNNDTAGPPLITFNNARPVPARADDPARAALLELEQRLRDEGRWADADLVAWIGDDLDRLPQPFGRVIRLLLSNGEPAKRTGASNTQRR